MFMVISPIGHMNTPKSLTIDKIDTKVNSEDWWDDVQSWKEYLEYNTFFFDTESLHFSEWIMVFLLILTEILN